MHQTGYCRPLQPTESLPRDAGFACVVPLPENASAFAALRQLARDVDWAVSPLFLHGPTGSGKSCLVTALAEELTDRAVSFLSANAFPLPWDTGDPTAAARYAEARQCELLIIEDMHHLPVRAAETLVQLLDERQRRGSPTVLTANAGPAQLAHRGAALPVRLTNRLASGLVVALEPLGAASRRLYLAEHARRRGMDIAADLLDWLAAVLIGGGRQLDGALHQLATLEQASVDDLQAQFQAQAEASQPTAERIVRRVSDYYRVAPRQLRSPRRQRRLLVPRQVSMYLLRRLTPLSLEQIGACFGGRDHTTVLHACRKVEDAMQRDAQLAGTVQQLQSEFV